MVAADRVHYAGVFELGQFCGASSQTQCFRGMADVRFGGSDSSLVLSRPGGLRESIGLEAAWVARGGNKPGPVPDCKVCSRSAINTFKKNTYALMASAVSTCLTIDARPNGFVSQNGLPARLVVRRRDVELHIHGSRRRHHLTLTGRLHVLQLLQGLEHAPLDRHGPAQPPQCDRPEGTPFSSSMIEVRTHR